MLDAPDVHGGDVADVDEGADAVDWRDGAGGAREDVVVGFEGFVDGGGGGGRLDGRAGDHAGVDGYDGPVGLGEVLVLLGLVDGRRRMGEGGRRGRRTLYWSRNFQRAFSAAALEAG